MDIILKAQCDVPDRVREEAVERLEHAARFFDRLSVIETVFRIESNRPSAQPAVVEVTGRTPRHHIRAQGFGSDHRSALDLAVTRFERQLSRYKARLVDRRRAGQRKPRPATPATAGSVISSPASSVSGDEHWPQPRIVRRKEFPLAAMTPEDAAVALELLDHEFFLFTDSLSGRSAVVYRRKDGDVGLICEADPADSAP